MLNEDTKKYMIIGGLAILFVLIIGLFSYTYFKDSNCKFERRTFLNDGLRYDSKCKVDKCLFIETNLGELYFAKEEELLSERLELEKGDEIVVRWCEIIEGEYRVKGIKKKRFPVCTLHGCSPVLD